MAAVVRRRPVGDSCAVGEGDRLFSVRGKRVLVTGGSQGVGAMIARGFVHAGATVAICGRDRAALEARGRELGADGDCRVVVGDVATEAGCRSVADGTVEALGGVDVLVNNAGATSTAPIDDFGDEAWDPVLAVNLKAAFYATRFLLAALRASSAPGTPSRVINVGSLSAERVGTFDNYAYTSSKAGLHHLTRHLARRLAPTVTVNGLSPGPFESPMMSPVLAAHGAAITASIPMGRIGRPDDIAAAAVYLASPGAAWITGTILTVDGGLSLT